MLPNPWIERTRLQRLRRETAKSVAGEEGKGRLATISKSLNSPLAIALISGLFVTAITDRWQAHSAQHASMEKSMIEFADQYGKLINLLPTLKVRELKVRELRLSSENDLAHNKVIDEKTTKALEAADKRYEEALAWVNALKDSSSLTSEVQAVFTSPIIGQETNTLDQLIDEIGTTDNLHTVLEDQAKALVIFRKSVHDMGIELRK